MMFSHLVLASLSSIFRKFSINLLSCRLKSPPMKSYPIDAAELMSFDDFEFVASPRGLEHISQTTLADEFSYVHAGQCHVLTIFVGVVVELFCRGVTFVDLPRTTPPVL